MKCIVTKCVKQIVKLKKKEKDYRYNLTLQYQCRTGAAQSVASAAGRVKEFCQLLIIKN